MLSLRQCECQSDTGKRMVTNRGCHVVCGSFTSHQIGLIESTVSLFEKMSEQRHHILLSFFKN